MQRKLLEEKAKSLEATIIIDKPYTNFGKTIATSSDAITIGHFAKVLNNNNINIGRNRLFTILRDSGYLIKVGKDKNMPKQVYVKQGLFKVAESVVKTVKGELLTATTLITGKGQMYFLELFDDLSEEKNIKRKDVQKHLQSIFPNEKKYLFLCDDEEFEINQEYINKSGIEFVDLPVEAEPEEPKKQEKKQPLLKRIGKYLLEVFKKLKNKLWR